MSVNPRISKTINNYYCNSIGFDGGINTYIYTGANPVVRVDENGEDFMDGIANKIASGNPRQNAYDNIVLIGALVGLDSDFEKRMSHRWLFAEGDYKLSYN